MKNPRQARIWLELDIAVFDVPELFTFEDILQAARWGFEDAAHDTALRQAAERIGTTVLADRLSTTLRDLARGGSK